MSIFNHCDVIGQQSYRIRWKKNAKRGYYAAQGHSTSIKVIEVGIIESSYATFY